MGDGPIGEEGPRFQQLAFLRSPITWFGTRESDVRQRFGCCSSDGMHRNCRAASRLSDMESGKGPRPELQAQVESNHAAQASLARTLPKVVFVGSVLAALKFAWLLAAGLPQSAS